MKETIHVLLGTNDKYLPGAIMTMVSILLANEQRGLFHFHVMDTGISDENRAGLTSFFAKWKNATLQFFAVDTECFARINAPIGPGGGYSTYARFLMTDYIAEDRCIYVDTDFFVRMDFSELWNLQLDNHAVAACLDTSKTGDQGFDKLSYDCPFDSIDHVSGYGYHNAGLLVCNLKYWRAVDFKRQALETIEKFGPLLKHHDQTVINYLFRGKIKQLPQEWNLPPWWTRPLDEVSNLHFTADKPWLGRSFLPAEAIWFDCYDQVVAPRWEVVKQTRMKKKGFLVFLRAWAIPALVAEFYCGLLFIASAHTRVYVRNRYEVLRAIRYCLLFGGVPATKRNIRQYRKQLANQLQHMLE